MNSQLISSKNNFTSFRKKKREKGKEKGQCVLLHKVMQLIKKRVELKYLHNEQFYRRRSFPNKHCWLYPTTCFFFKQLYQIGSSHQHFQIILKSFSWFFTFIVERCSSGTLCWCKRTVSRQGTSRTRELLCHQWSRVGLYLELKREEYRVVTYWCCFTTPYSLFYLL